MDIPTGKGLLGYFTQHRTASNLLLIVLVILGLAAAPQMRAQYFPDIVTDDIRVSVAWDGAGPEDVDRALIGPMLPVLQAVEGVQETETRATEGSARIELEFEPGWDMARAQQDVETALDTVTDLPEDADAPSVARRAWRDSVTDVVISGPAGVDQLARFADEFVAELFDAGVTRTTIQGVADPETEVIVQTRDMIRYDVTMSDIADAIASAAESNPAGEIESANARLRSGVARRSADEIEAIVLRTYADGSSLTVGDVAQINPTSVDRDRAYYVGDNPAVAINVARSATGDAIKLQRAVEDVADKFQQTLPPDVTVDLIRTRAEQISARLNILIENGLQGLVLVLGLLFLFLNARIAFWVAAGIPVSMLTAIAIMYGFGISLNMISLFGLIITLGIVVDDAIVVGEHADFRARRLGEPAPVAAERAARHMALPVVCATLTTVIAFFGLTVIEGGFGAMIKDIPVTVIAVLLASLVECFLILPNHLKHAVAHTAKEHWYDWPSRQVNRGFRWFRDNVFRRFIELVLAMRYPVIAGAMVVLASQAALFIKGDVQWRFFDSPEQGSISGNFAMAPGATREDSIAQMRELQRAAEAVAARYEEEFGLNPLTYMLTQIGGTSGRGLAGEDTKEAFQLGSVAIELIDADLRPYSSFAFVEALQQEARNHPLAETVSFRGWRSGPGGDALDVKLYGASSERLKDAAEGLKSALAGFPEVSALEDSMAYDKEEFIVELSPQGQLLGFTIDEVGRELRYRLNGVEAVTYPDGTRTGRILVDLPDEEKTADFLEQAMLRAPSGQYVPLADLVTVERESGFSTIRRENGLRVITVTGDISDDDPQRANEILTTMRDTILPRIESEYQVGWQLGGLSEQERDFLSDASRGLTLCMLGIFLTLAWMFSSWTRPLAIMAIIPFGCVGAIWGHYAWGLPMSMFSIVGLIGMTGIIVNDSIVLIATVDEYAKNRPLRAAVRDAVCDRLRPVMLTTMTTVLGLGPLMYESSQQAQFLKPTVVTLVYGLAFGMLLVLIAVPAMLIVGRDMAQSLRAARRSLGAGRRAGPAFGASATLAVLIGLWFAATLGSQLTVGQMLISTLFPEVALAGGNSFAFAWFAAGATLLTAVVLGAGAVWVVRENRSV
ncbi:efflux RND transporter permease subunit [Qingshengfaniella alkalisoli]|uniref:Efflux RND transporter permease subunit n=1 Tax=Qingshengfaniella alkalisoli TaxID=2599296 RepID=A0A5B8J2T4_9RHOB|nr:efflux RND transporter permease subunit [Qingshengfaniella alkalisoli]QDY68570.1 efflux RND transporter permease subunit [Qingshengfaniella alkalisoli]